MNSAYIKVTGNKEVLEALCFLLPQLTQGLNPWNLKVEEVITELPDYAEDDIEVEDDIEWKEKETFSPPLQKSIEGLDSLKNKLKEPPTYKPDYVENDIEWEEEETFSPPLQGSLEESIEGLDNLKSKLTRPTYSIDNDKTRNNNPKSIEFVEVNGLLLIEIEMKKDMNKKQINSFGRYLCQSLKGVDYRCVPNAKLEIDGSNYAKVTPQNNIFVLALTPLPKPNNDSISQVIKAYPNIKRISL